MKYDNIKIKLISTLDNRIKEQTDCSPNGYYFLPIYDKGDYYFEIEGPEGWNFESNRIKKSINKKEECNEDINFILSGFRVEGYAKGDGECLDNKKGLQSIKVELFSSDGKQLIQTTETSSDGHYTFENVVPGSYVIVGSHPDWYISNQKLQVLFEWGNLMVSEPIIVNGFSVSGSIFNGNDPVGDVVFNLYSNSVNQIKNCSPKSKINYKGLKQICSINSDKSGKFEFKNVPCGKYLVVPEFQDEHTKYDIAPSEYDLKVLTAGGMQISNRFEIMGFSVSGKVVDHSNQGIPDVTILVNGKVRATTNANGTYTLLEQVSASTINIEAKKEHMTFGPINNYRMTATNPVIPPIHADTYHLCGKVVVPSPPPEVKVNPREISLQSSNGNGNAEIKEKTTTDANGKFCFDVKPGTYTVSVSLSPSEKSKGLQFASLTATTTITNKPQLEILFNQVRASLFGKINPLHPITDDKVPTGLEIKVSSVSRPSEQPINVVPVIKSATGEIGFSVRDILPGTYKVQVLNLNWCWKDNVVSKEIELYGTDKKNVEFTQSGYGIDIIAPNSLVSSTHSHGGSSKTDQLKQGPNRFCFAEKGNHKFEFKSCFKLNRDSYEFNTHEKSSTTPRKIDLYIEKYILSGSIVTKKETNDTIVVQVFTKNSDKPLDQIKVVKSSDEKNRYTYQYTTGLDQQELEFRPKITSKNSDHLMFYPSSRVYNPVVNFDQCPSPIQEIQSRSGLFISGTVLPGIDGVEIKAFNSDDKNDNAVQTVLSGSDGRFKLGPLYDDQEYVIKASKPGFHFKKDSKSNDFVAVQLGSVIITVRDSQSKEPVQGVFVSLSSDAYRQTLVTPQQGDLHFQSIFPGTYFMKSFLKEYSLSPSSETIEVAEGKPLTIEILATRTAFSVLGSVSSLNGQLLSLVTVQAIRSDGSVLEESQSDEHGIYRLRGLSPKETYTIVVKDDKIEKSSPPLYRVTPGKENVNNINFIVFQQQTTFDLTGHINVDLTSSKLSRTDIPSLKVNIYNERDGSLYRSIEMTADESSNFFDFGALPKSNTYLLRVEQDSLKKKFSSLGFSTTPKELSINPSATPGKSYDHVSLSISYYKSATSQDSESVPVAGLIFFAIVVVSVLYPSKVWKFITSLKNNVKKQKKLKSSQIDEDSGDGSTDFLPNDLRKQLLKNKKKK
eukprot:gene8344-10249_t